jgi:ABC-type lipoprotein release transport system permease subunit
VTLALTLFAVAVLAVVASAVPAWRASRIKPREALG